MLRTDEQTIRLSCVTHEDGVNQAGVSDAQTMPELATPLLATSPERAKGTHTATPVLLVAEPGAGKTWSSIQLARSLALQCAKQEEAVPLVPVLIYVQRLSRMLREQPTSLPVNSSILMQYFVRELGSSPFRGTWLDMFAQAFELRSLILIIDGIDEAAGRKDSISRFIRQLLVPLGIRVVCTSRPEGVSTDLFSSHFVILNLLALSDEQQRDASARQLGPHGRDFSDHLMAFATIRAKHDLIFRATAPSDLLPLTPHLSRPTSHLPRSRLPREGQQESF